MSIALKYTTFKDASIPLHNFKTERSRQWLRTRGKSLVVVSTFVIAVLLPFFFIYALIGPQGYRPWSATQAQASEASFVEEYAASPVPARPQPDYFTAQ